MSERDFPTARLVKAGASRDEIAVIRSEFERSDVAMQRLMLDNFASIAIGDLRDDLDERRENGDFDADARRVFDDDEPESTSGASEKPSDEKTAPSVDSAARGRENASESGSEHSGSTDDPEG